MSIDKNSTSNIDCFVLFIFHVDVKNRVSIKFRRNYTISYGEKVRTRSDVMIFLDNILTYPAVNETRPSKSDMHKDKARVSMSFMNYELIYIYE
jgi:hypothetical protein